MSKEKSMSKPLIKSTKGKVVHVSEDRVATAVDYGTNELLTFDGTQFHSGWPVRSPRVDDRLSIRRSLSGEFLDARLIKEPVGDEKEESKTRTITVSGCGTCPLFRKGSYNWICPISLTKAGLPRHIEARTYLDRRPRRETRPKWCELPVLVVARET